LSYENLLSKVTFRNERKSVKNGQLKNKNVYFVYCIEKIGFIKSEKRNAICYQCLK